MAPLPQSKVVLLGIDRYGFPNVAAEFLKNWARRDPDLKGVPIEAMNVPWETTVEETARLILGRRPELVGFTCFLWNVRKTLQVVGRIKKDRPQVKIVLGGPEVSPIAEKMLAGHAELDFTSFGEGERALHGLLRSLFLGDRPLSKVPGLVYRDGAAVVKTAEPPLVDLDGFPAVYEGAGGGLRGLRAVMETARGCPFLCAFCDWGPRKMRYLPMEQVEGEFRALAERFDFVWLSDADPLMDQKRGVALLEAFLRAAEDSPICLHFETNPTFLCREAADVIARRPGRFHIGFGLQSVSAETLQRMHRPFDLEKIERNLAYFKSVAPSAQFMFSLIYGLPGDDLASFRKSVDWIFQWRPTSFTAGQFLMLPGADISHEAHDARVRHQPEPPYQIYETDVMSPEDMRRARKLAFYGSLLFDMKPCLEALFGRVDPARMAPGSRVELLEGWIEHLEAQGVDLTFGAPALETDEYLTSERSLASLEALKKDKLLTASVLLATRAFAESAARRAHAVHA